MLVKIEKFFDKIADIIGYLCAAATILMMLNVFVDVVLRYFFKTGSVALEELEWHFFSIVILLGLSYTLKTDSHVRVDIFYSKIPYKKKAIINIVGTLLFLLPITLLVAVDSIPYAIESFRSNEGSGDPGGLAYWWIIKWLIPLSFWILAFYSIGFIIKNINLYKGQEERDLMLSSDKKVLE